MPFGSPGNDIQPQAMLQVLLNVNVFGMDVQSAIEAPRFATYSFPSSSAPHAYHPGRLILESRIPAATGDELAARGHDVKWWPDVEWRAGAVCTIRRESTDRHTRRRRRPAAAGVCAWLVTVAYRCAGSYVRSHWSASIICASGASAGDWRPEKPVEIISGVAAGGALDIMARAMQKVWQEKRALAVPSTVVNRPAPAARSRGLI